jgi:hypothetical protein
MSIPVPNLDDRNFSDLVAAASARITAVDPLWTDLSLSDPGMVLVDAFAHLTDILLYRLNRVPDRVYAIFLNLLGTQLRPPCAATVVLQFTRTDATSPFTAPEGMRVGVARPDSSTAPVFLTIAPVVFAAGDTQATALAVHADTHQGVVLGTGTGLPGQTVTLPSVPAVQGDARIAVETDPDATPSGGGFVLDGKQFRDWQEVATFADAAPGDEVYLIDRVIGTVTFAPALGTGTGLPAPVAAVPGSGREIRGWWRSGGGAPGNVDAGTLTVLRDPLPGISVTNPAQAAGGRDTESVADAMVRAPIDFHTRQRAVTAGDYQVLAIKASGAVQRAQAYNRSDIWSFAQPGEVEVVLVAADSAIPPDEGAEAIRQQVLQYLQDRAPLGVTCMISWAKYKTVAVHARVVVRSEEDPAAVKSRIEAGLNDTIGGQAGTDVGFGATLRLSNLYRPLQHEEPGVIYVDEVWFIVDDVPDANVGPLMPDGYQLNTWFAGAGPVLFRTLDRGDGWEPSGEFPGEIVWTVAPYPSPPTGRPGALARPGWVAVGTRAGDRSRLYVSRDLGEHWDLVADVGWGISDLAWVERIGGPILLVAGTAGMYEVTPEPNATAVQVVVDPSQADLGYYAVDAFLDYRGTTGVVVAAEGSSGVWLSDQAGASNSYYNIRRQGDDIRALAVQYDGPVTYVWSARAVSDPSDTGCVRLRVDDLTQIDHTGVLTAWETLDAGWTGGSCWQVSFGGLQAYAASQSGGVLRMDLSAGRLQWRGLGMNCGLPRRDAPPSLSPVQSVAVTADGKTVLAAGQEGVYRSLDGGDNYQSVSQRVAHDFVTLPPTWLFRPGAHQITVDRVNEASLGTGHAD